MEKQSVSDRRCGDRIAENSQTEHLSESICLYSLFSFRFVFFLPFFLFDLITLLLVEFGCLAFTLLKHPMQIQCSFSMVHAIAGEVAAGRGT